MYSTVINDVVYASLLAVDENLSTSLPNYWSLPVGMVLLHPLPFDVERKYNLYLTCASALPFGLVDQVLFL